MTATPLDHLRAGVRRAGLAIDDVRLPFEHDVIANGIRLHLVEWRPDEATPTSPPVVLLHGGSLTARTWDLVALALSRRHHCVAVDLRGHGNSEWPADGDYRHAALAADVAAVIDDLALARPVVVGQSMGGLAAIRLAGERSDRLAGLVVVDIGPDLRADAAREIMAFTQHDQVLDDVDAFVERALAFNPRRRRDLLRQSLRHNLRQLPDGRWTWKWDTRRLRDVDLERLRVEHAALWEWVGRIRCPTLVVRGERSRVFLAEDEAALAAAIPGARRAVVAGAGHTVQGDNPAGLLDVLEPFLTDITEATTP